MNERTSTNIVHNMFMPVAVVAWTLCIFMLLSCSGSWVCRMLLATATVCAALSLVCAYCEASDEGEEEEDELAEYVDL